MGNAIPSIKYKNELLYRWSNTFFSLNFICRIFYASIYSVGNSHLLDVLLRVLKYGIGKRRVHIKPTHNLHLKNLKLSV